MNKLQPFRQHHITKALRACRDAGVEPNVEVRLPGGASLVVGRKEADTKPPGARKAPTSAKVRSPRP